MRSYNHFFTAKKVVLRMYSHYNQCSVIKATKNINGSANRHHLPGYVWHTTHRCHKKEFLLKFEKDKKRYTIINRRELINLLGRH